MVRRSGKPGNLSLPRRGKCWGRGRLRGRRSRSRAAWRSAWTARWVMITSGTGLWSGASSPGSCWITLAMLMPLLTQYLGQPGEHAGPVGDREMEVIAALDPAGGSEHDGGGRFGPEVQHSRRQSGPAGHDVDQVADDRRGGRHRARASAVEEGVSHGVANHADRVVRAADLGQRRPVLDQGRRDAQLQPVFRELRQGQQLDGIAKLAGVLEVGQMQAVDALAVNVVEPDARLEGQLGQDRQLVGGVGTVDVQGRIGLGVTELLGPGAGLPRRASPRGSSASR